LSKLISFEHAQSWGIEDESLYHGTNFELKEEQFKDSHEFKYHKCTKRFSYHKESNSSSTFLL